MHVITIFFFTLSMFTTAIWFSLMRSNRKEYAYISYFIIYLICSIYIFITAMLFYFALEFVLSIHPRYQNPFYSFLFLSVIVSIVGFFHGLRVNNRQSRARKEETPRQITLPEVDTIIDINSASESELASIPEIGPIRARRIYQRALYYEKLRSFEELVEYLGLNEFDSERLKGRFIFTSGENQKEDEKPRRGRIIDY